MELKDAILMISEKLESNEWTFSALLDSTGVFSIVFGTQELMEEMSQASDTTELEKDSTIH